MLYMLLIYIGQFQDIVLIYVIIIIRSYIKKKVIYIITFCASAAVDSIMFFINPIVNHTEHLGKEIN